MADLVSNTNLLDWATGANWGGAAPTSADSATIATGSNVQITTAAEANSVAVNGSLVLDMAGSLTVAVEISNDGYLVLNAPLTVPSLSNTGYCIANDTLTVDMVSNSGTLLANGDLTVNDTSSNDAVLIVNSSLNIADGKTFQNHMLAYIANINLGNSSVFAAAFDTTIAGISAPVSASLHVGGVCTIIGPVVCSTTLVVRVNGPMGGFLVVSGSPVETGAVYTDPNNYIYLDASSMWTDHGGTVHTGPGLFVADPTTHDLVPYASGGASLRQWEGMTVPILRKYAAAATIDGVSLTSKGSTSAQVNPTLAAGDVKVSIDGGAWTNLATLPVVTPASSTSVRVSLSASELTGKQLRVRFADQTSPAEWDEREIAIDTFGHADAQFAIDFSAAAATETTVAAIKAKTDNLPATPANETTATAIKAKTDALPEAPASETTSAAIKAKTDTIAAAPTPAEIEAALAAAHGSGAWDGAGSSPTGDGDLPLNHNTGGADTMRCTYRGDGVQDVRIRAYLKSEWDAEGGRGAAAVKGMTRTGADGRWAEDLMLSAGTYTITFEHPQYRFANQERTLS